jgi:hypothetical protein
MRGHAHAPVAPGDLNVPSHADVSLRAKPTEIQMRSEHLIKGYRLLKQERLRLGCIRSDQGTCRPKLSQGGTRKRR